MNKTFKIIFLSLFLSFIFPLETKASVVIPCTANSTNCQQINKEKQLLSAMYQQIGTQRLQTIEAYRPFFDQVGFQVYSTSSLVYYLGSATTYQFEDWQKTLIQAKTDYEVKQKQIADQKIVDEQAKIDQENKIKELENRVSELENQKIATDTPVIQKVEPQIPVIAPVVPKKIERITPTKVKPPINKEVIKPVEQNTSTSSGNILPIPTEQMPVKKLTWWKQLFDWFKR